MLVSYESWECSHCERKYRVKIIAMYTKRIVGILNLQNVASTSVSIVKVKQCHHCGKIFIRQGQGELTTHERIHSGNRLYQCHTM